MAKSNRLHLCLLVIFIVSSVSSSSAASSSLSSSSSVSRPAKTQSSTEWRRKWNEEPREAGHRKKHRHSNHKNRTPSGETTVSPSRGADGPEVNSQPFISHRSTTNSPPVDGLSPWSAWSKCNKDCRQWRHRQCRPESSPACADVRLRQERICRKGRCKRKAFHVVLPPKRESLKQPQSTPQSDVRVLLSLNSIFYSSWSRWTPCTQTCTTTRYRSCRFPVVCGNTVLHEEAYCYSEGTDCEKWYSHRTAHNETIDHGYEPPKTTPAPPVRSSNTNPPQPKKEKPAVTAATAVTQVNVQHECGVSTINPYYTLQLRIIGGREATPGRWPWQVAILNRYKEAFCGGTLIGTRWVLTAAHCLRKRLFVRIGEYDLAEYDGTEIDYRVEEVFVHPDYDPETVDNDVALLRLPESVQTVHGIRMACLPQPRQLLPITQKCTIIGWGKESSTNVYGTEVLHEAEVPIVKTSACREVYEDYFITENMFCAGYRKGRIDSCAGDSGGPLLCQVGSRWTIFGITSFGEGCGKRGKYGIYTKVPNYVTWIQRVIDLNGGS